jgi:hypothetical protein
MSIPHIQYMLENDWNALDTGHTISTALCGPDHISFTEGSIGFGRWICRLAYDSDTLMDTKVLIIGADGSLVSSVTVPDSLWDGKYGSAAPTAN